MAAQHAPFSKLILSRKLPEPPALKRDLLCLGEILDAKSSSQFSSEISVIGNESVKTHRPAFVSDQTRPDRETQAKGTHLTCAVV